MRIAGIDKHLSIGPMAHEIIQFALRLDHPLKRTEALKMRHSHVGDEGQVGFYDVHQCSDVAGMTGSHLHNGHLMFGLESQQRRSLSVGARDAHDAGAQHPAMVSGQLL